MSGTAEDLFGETREVPVGAEGYHPTPWEGKYRLAKARTTLRELGHPEPAESPPIEVAISLAKGEEAPLGPDALLRECVEVARQAAEPRGGEPLREATASTALLRHGALDRCAHFGVAGQIAE